VFTVSDLEATLTCLADAHLDRGQEKLKKAEDGYWELEPGEKL
jgi:hypothetical protein